MIKLIRWIINLFKGKKQYRLNYTVEHKNPLYNEDDFKGLKSDCEVTTLRHHKHYTEVITYKAKFIRYTSGGKHCYVSCKYGVIRKPIGSVRFI